MSLDSAKRYYNRIRNDPKLWEEHLEKQKSGRRVATPEDVTDENNYIEPFKTRKRTTPKPKTVDGIDLTKLMGRK